MSSIRIRLSRMWNNRDGENSSPADSRRPSTTNSLAHTQDSGFWSITSLRSRSNTSSSGLNTTSAENVANIEAKDSNYNGQRSASRFSSSTRSIHDVASSTFKFVSDTLRSKTNLFYVESARSVTPFPIESNTGSKHQLKPRILSSLRSRRSHSDKLNLEARAVVTSYTHVPEIPHELHVDIPDHTLLQTGSNESDAALFGAITSNVAVQTSVVLPQRTITKQSVLSKEFSDESDAETCVSASDSAMQRSSEKAGMELRSSDASRSHKGSDLSEVGSLHDENYTRETARYKGKPCKKVSQTDCCFVAPAPRASRPTRQFRISGNLFVKGNREQTRRIGTPSPYQRALQSSDSCEVLPEHSAETFGSTDGLNTLRENSLLSRPSISRATSFTRGLSNLVMTDGENGEVGEKWVIEGKLSECYDGDADSFDEVPNMGPRSPWDKARADRLKRYQLVRTMSAGTESDTSEDSGLRLRPYKEISKFRSNPLTNIPDGNRNAHLVMRGDNGRNTNLGETQPGQVTQSALVECPRMANEVVAIEVNNKTTGRDAWYVANESLTESGCPAPAMEISSHDCPNHYSCDRSFPCTSIAYDVNGIERHEGVRMHSSEETSQDDPGSSIEKNGLERSTRKMPEINARHLQNDAVTPLRPSSVRKISSYSISTTDSCAITTSSPLCYRNSSIPTVHVHTTPVRRTSSINDEIHQVRNESESGDSFVVHPIIAKSVSENMLLIEVPPPSPSSKMFPIGSQQTSFMENTDEINRSGNEFYKGHAENGHSLECLLKGVRLDDDELFTEGQMSPGLNSLDASRTSSMCAPITDFAQAERSGTDEDVLDSESALDSDKVVCSMMDGHEFFPTVDDKAPSCESEDMGTWLAEHPEAESLAESDIELASYGNESDFFPVNPELGHYLDRDFPDIPCSEGKAERSDDGNDGFLTPLTTPSKCTQLAKQFSSSLRMQLSEMDTEYYCKMEPVYCESGDVDIVIARPPTYVSTQPQVPRSLSGNASSPRDSTELFEEENLLRDITPTALGSGRNRKISWQMRDSSYDGEDFTYEAIGSPQQVLQSSSSKKGVWWGRELDSDQRAGSPLGAKQDGDLSIHECDTEEEVYRHIHNIPFRMKTGMDNNLLALLATASIHNRDCSSTTATGISDSIVGNEDAADLCLLDASHKANESATTTKDNCTAVASKDIEQGQDANQLGGFLAAPVHYDQRLQTHRQEVQTIVEPYQGETLVIDDIEDFRVVGAWPRPTRHTCGHVSEDSWYTFD